MLDTAVVLEAGARLNPPPALVELGAGAVLTLPKLNPVEAGAADKPEACVDVAEPKLNPLESDGAGLAGVVEICG